jgi:FkbM family methyltransferase
MAERVSGLSRFRLLPRLLALRLAACYARAFAPEWGGWRLALYALGEAKQLGHLLGRRTVGTKHGFRMDLDLSEWLGQHVYATGNWEDYTAFVIRALVQEGDTVIDVGANLGFFTLLAARCVGEKGRVIAFEPVPAVRDQLLHNVKLNDFGNVEVREEAASDADGQAIIHVGPREHSGISSFRPLGKSAEGVKVQTCRLDSLAVGKPPLRLVKIDVEGAEHKVLCGMQDLLSQQRPDIILELTDVFLKELGGSAEQVYDGLTKSGYRTYVIANDELSPVPAWSSKLNTQLNALFTCRSQLPAVLKVGTPVG